MSWLYSIIFAGLMFSTESNLPATQNTDYFETKTIVKTDETERFEQTYPLSANGRVSVSNVNGSITIETWDNNQIKLEAVKTAESKEKLADVEIQIDAKPDSFSVETNYGDGRRNGGNWNSKVEVEYRLTVPRNAVLSEIEAVNGSISISNAYNLTKASAVNGGIKATNLRGTANLSTVNGTVEADFDQLQTGSKISLNTVNGTVNLTIPSDANATLRADSVNGNITNDFGLPVRKGQYVGRDLYGKVGSGDVQIRLTSVNGALTIKRKADGKNVNPATNLLQQKSEDEDFDDDDDDDSETESRVVKSQKEVEKEMKAVEKEMKAVEREVEKITAESMVNVAPVIAEVIPNVSPVTSEETQKKMEEAQRRQEAALAKMSEINWNSSSPVIERKTETFTVKGTPKVTIDAKNCDVNVRGWDQSEVRYVVTKMSKDRSQSPLEFKTENTDSVVKITVANAGASVDLTRVSIEVFVPKKTNLKVVTNREIRLEGVSGEIDLSGADASVNVRDSDGILNVRTADGKIRVIGFKGEIVSQTADGEMDLEGDFQKLSAHTVDGKIVLTLPETTNAILDSNVEIESEGFNLIRESEGAMRWRIGRGNAVFDLKTSDGRIFVRNANVLKA